MERGSIVLWHGCAGVERGSVAGMESGAESGSVAGVQSDSVSGVKIGVERDSIVVSVMLITKSVSSLSG